MVITLKSHDLGLPGSRKACRAVIFHMRMDKSAVTGTTIYAATENSNTFTSAGTVAAALGTTKVETFRVALPTPRFVFLQLKLTNSVKDEEFVLSGVDYLAAVIGSKGVKERSEL